MAMVRSWPIDAVPGCCEMDSEPKEATVVSADSRIARGVEFPPSAASEPACRPPAAHRARLTRWLPLSTPSPSRSRSELMVVTLTAHPPPPQQPTMYQSPRAQPQPPQHRTPPTTHHP